MTDVGLGDEIVNDEKRLAALQWHSLHADQSDCRAPDTCQSVNCPVMFNPWEPVDENSPMTCDTR